MRIAAILQSPSPQSTMTKIPSPPLNIHQRPPWHSPIPYLFGGLAAMLGLITLALLILACSYWKLSDNQVSNNGSETDDTEQQSDLENGDDDNHGKSKTTYEEKILVIMAGDLNPTFLATPMVNCNIKSSSFGDCVGENVNEKTGEKTEKEKQIEQSAIRNEDCEEMRVTHVDLGVYEQTQ